MPDQSSFIGNYLTAYVPNDAELIDLGYTVVRFYVAASESGAYSLVGTATLVDNTKDYSYNHTTGLATDWFYWAPYGATPGEGPASEPQPVGPPRVTRKQIRQGVGAYLSNCDVYTLASVSSSTVAIISALIDPDASPHGIANRYSRCVGGTATGQTRRIRSGSTGYAVATGQITVNRAYSSAWVADDEVELWVPYYDRDPSVAIDDAMQWARSKIWWEDSFYFSTENDVTEYTMPQMMREDYIKRIEWAADTYPSRPGWQPIPFWDFTVDSGAPVLSIAQNAEQRGSAFSQGEVIRVVWNRFGDRMDSDTDYWEVPLEWAVSQVAAEYLSRRVRPRGGNEDTADAVASLARVERDLGSLKRTYMPTPAVGMKGPR